MVKINSYDDRLGKLESLLGSKPVLPIHIYYMRNNQTREQAIQVYAGGDAALYNKLLRYEVNTICIEVIPALKTIQIAREGENANK